MSLVLSAWKEWDAQPGDARRVAKLEAALTRERAPRGAREAILALRRGGAPLADAISAVLACAQPPAPTFTTPPPGRAATYAPSPARRGPQGSRSKPLPAPARPSRYCTLVTDGRRLARVTDSRFANLESGTAAELAAAAVALADGAQPSVWIHETAGLVLDDTWLAGCEVDRRDEQATATIIVPGARVLIVPAAETDFSGTGTARELLEALAAFERICGLAYVNSPGSTGHALILNSSRRHRLGPPHEHPAQLDQVKAGGEWADSLWFEGGSAWVGPLPPWATHLRPYDRNASYLAAWGGLACSDGPWSYHRDVRLDGGESSKPAGYWLLDVTPLEERLAGWAPNPFARHGISGGPRWFTTPLAQFAQDQADDLGVQLVAREVWWAAEAHQYLTGPADTLKAARLEMTEPGLTAVKRLYSRSTQWFEFSSKGPLYVLHRPHWRRSIVDRNAANTWRKWANNCGVFPVAQTQIDTLWFPLADPDQAPDGLPVSTKPGDFKVAGPPVPVGELADALAAGPRQFLRTVIRRGDRP